MPSIMFNQNDQTLHLERTGHKVAFSPSGQLWIPDISPNVPLEVGCQLILGMLRIHGCRFGPGQQVAAYLSAGGFGATPEWKVKRYSERDLKLCFDNDSETIRMKGHNIMLMAKIHGKWCLDFDSAADEGLVLNAFKILHGNPECHDLCAEELIRCIEKRDIKRTQDVAM